jgi:hypothetical protein
VTEPPRRILTALNETTQKELKGVKGYDSGGSERKNVETVTRQPGRIRPGQPPLWYQTAGARCFYAWLRPPLSVRQLALPHTSSLSKNVSWALGFLSFNIRAALIWFHHQC